MRELLMGYQLVGFVFYTMHIPILVIMPIVDY